MRFEDTISSRARQALIALAALATTAALAAPAQAASGEGAATIALANAKKGRTLSGQGVRILAVAPAAKTGNSVSLPISALELGADARASVDGSLRFKRGKRATVVRDLRIDLTAGTLEGKLGGNRIPLFWLGAAPGIDAAAGTVSLSGKLRLTEAAGLVLKQKLRLKKAVKRTGVGGIAISAKAKPTEAAARPIASGGATWGVRTELREYILLAPPGGSIAIGDGATASGSLSDPTTVFGFPAAGGSFVKGLYGAAEKLQLKLEGNVTLVKTAHCIAALRFANVEVKLDGADSSITADTTLDKTAPCPDEPPVVTPDVELGKLDLTGIAASWSADGKTATWTAIPATITAAGSAAFDGYLSEGDALDPITIAVTLG